MNFAKGTKAALIGLWLVGALALAASGSLSQAADKSTAQQTPAKADASQYVGTETCQGCHEAQFNDFSKSAHAGLAHAGWKETKQGCESCHGPGRAHVEGGGDKSLIRTFEKETAKQISQTCLECHGGRDNHNNYLRSEHFRNNGGCIDCHSPHGEPVRERVESASFMGTTLPGGRETRPDYMLKRRDPQLCMSCHSETKSAFTMPFHHRVLEGAMKCSDCHNPHGGFEQKQTQLAIGADTTCLKCHTDKQGPFVFEHAPLKTEGCASCHSPHGSANPNLLKRANIAQLCIECHSGVHDVGAPNTPSFHNLATARIQNCTTCHVKIHGSHTNQLFFR